MFGQLDLILLLLSNWSLDLLWDPPKLQDFFDYGLSIGLLFLLLRLFWERVLLLLLLIFCERVESKFVEIRKRFFFLLYRIANAVSSFSSLVIGRSNRLGIRPNCKTSVTMGLILLRLMPG